MTEDFEKLMERKDFTVSQMQSLLSQIANGDIPQKDDVNTAVASLQTYVSDADALCEKIEKKIGLAGQKRNVISFKQMYEVYVENSTKKLQEAASVIQDFMNVSSSEEKYSSALKEYQDKSAEMLASINESKKVPDTSAQKLFLDALKDKNDELIDRLEGVFSDTVMFGVLRNKYSIQSQPSENQESPFKVTAFESPIQICNVLGGGVLKALGKAEMVVEQKNVQPADDGEKMINPVNAPSNKSPSANEFIKNMKRTMAISDGLPFHVFAILTSLSMLSVDQFTCIQGCLPKKYMQSTDKSVIQKTLDFLCRCGYLNGYDFKKNRYYCLTSYGLKSLTKQTSLEFFNHGIPVAIRKDDTPEFYGDQPVSSLELERIARRNSKIIGLHQRYSKFETGMSASSLYSARIRASKLSTPFEIGKKSVLLAYSDVDIALGTDEDLDGVMLLSDDMHIPTAVCEGKTFCIKDKIYVFADGKWTDAVSWMKAQETAEEPQSENVQDTPEEPQPKLAQESPADSDVETPQECSAEPEAHPEPEQEISVANEPLQNEGCGIRFADATTISEKAKVLRERYFEGTIPSEDDVFDIFKSLVKENRIAESGVFLHSFACDGEHFPRIKQLYDGYALAFCLDENQIPRTSEKISEVFDTVEPLTSAKNDVAVLGLLATISSLLFPDSSERDYGLGARAEELIEAFDSNFDSSLIKLKSVLNVSNGLMNDGLTNGFSKNIIMSLADEQTRQKKLTALASRARELLADAGDQANHFLPMIAPRMNELVGHKSDICHCLSLLADESLDLDTASVCLYSYLSNGLLDEKTITEKAEEICSLNVSRKPSNILVLKAKNAVFSILSKRITVIYEWYLLNNAVDAEQIGKRQRKRNEIVRKLQDSCETVSQSDFDDRFLVIAALKQAETRLMGDDNDNRNEYMPFLLSGVFPMTDAYVPVVNENLVSVKYAEPWMTILYHLELPKSTAARVKEEIHNPVSRLFDNLHQLQLIDPQTSQEVNKNIDGAKSYADDCTNEFCDVLELSYAYGQIDEVLKEDIFHNKELFQEFFCPKSDDTCGKAFDYACWRQFLAALKKQIGDSSRDKADRLRIDLQEREKCPLIEEATKLLEENNFALVEEYLNRYDAGERDVCPGKTEGLGLSPYYKQFLELNDELYAYCNENRDSTFKTSAKAYVNNHRPNRWTTRNFDASDAYISHWPAVSSSKCDQSVKQLLQSIGFGITSLSTKERNGNVRKLSVTVKPIPKNKREYLHPIAAFGTEMSDMDVLVMEGHYTFNSLMNAISANRLAANSIVILDSPVDLRDRSQIAEKVHGGDTMLQQGSFLLLDNVLALFLALQTDEERLQAFLQCAVPYTNCQPFTGGSGATADEMFIGRTRELDSIMSPKGANIVYGGRQLGKTALLLRAKSLTNDSANNVFSVYANVQTCDSEEKFARAVGEAIIKDCHCKQDFAQVSDVKGLCTAIELMIDSGKIKNLLLLVDESDNFFASIRESRYSCIEPLVTLMRTKSNKFKVVFAGLHNVCRAKNSTVENGIFGQFGTPLCIKPLSPLDAQNLLLRPLKYVGFNIDEKIHLETITTNTNYYPGILQFFGQKLVESLASNYASNFYSAADGNPPYVLSKEQLAAVINSGDINDAIKNKLRLTLSMDPRYFMLARCLVLCFHILNEEESRRIDFSVDEIMEMSGSEDIKCLENLSRNEIRTLLGEMVEMGILSQRGVDDSMYRLRRQNFVGVIGSNPDSIERDIREDQNEQ